MNYIRTRYGVPAKVGGRIWYSYGKVHGAIVGARGPYLRVRLDGEKHPCNMHPTWCVEYL